jgi:hypothetical protein
MTKKSEKKDEKLPAATFLNLRHSSVAILEKKES